LGQLGECQYGRQYILAPVFGLPTQSGDLFLVPFRLANVPGDLGRSDDLALGIFDGRNRQRDRDQTTMFTLPNRLVMFDPLASPDAVQNRAFLAAGMTIVIG